MALQLRTNYRAQVLSGKLFKRKRERERERERASKTARESWFGAKIKTIPLKLIIHSATKLLAGKVRIAFIIMDFRAVS